MTAHTDPVRPYRVIPTDRDARLPNLPRLTGEAATARRIRPVQAVLNAIDVLQVLGRFGREVGVSEIARHTGLSKAATYNILATLETRHLVARTPGASTYRLGWGLYELGVSVTRDLDLARIARTQLDQLADRTGETVLLAIIEDDSVLYLDRGESPNSFRLLANVGRRSPIHASASGKAILAFADEREIDRVLGQPLRQCTRTTVTDPDELRRQLVRVSRVGYATCWQEHEVGMSSIAVPLRDHTGTVVAALTLAGPATRVTRAATQRLVAALRDVADVIEARLGASR